MSTQMLHTYPTPFSDLNAVLHELVASAQAVLGENFLAAYLQGSFAVGDFDADSDVDFLIVTHEEVTESELAALQEMHVRIHALDSEWAKHLDGSYISKTTLKRFDLHNPPLWYLDNGSSALVSSRHDDTLVVRWVLREHGITLAGPAPQSLIETVMPEELKQEVRNTMREWGEELIAAPDQMNNRWYQPFAVLSYCRMLHTLDTGRVESKRAGAEWAKASLDSRWTGLIERAWNERPNPSLKVRQSADLTDFYSTVEFIRYAIHTDDLQALSE
jgi:predicted nucleotidyltransferase